MRTAPPNAHSFHSPILQHRYFRPARTIFFSLLGLGSFLLLFFSLQAVFHTASSHAPGADSSSSAPPATHKLASSLDESARLSNGTHAWRRTIVVVSLDGVKSRWLDDGWLPHLQKLGTNQSAERGARRARSMTPVFPTLTFPNHWALLWVILLSHSNAARLEELQHLSAALC